MSPESLTCKIKACVMLHSNIYLIFFHKSFGDALLDLLMLCILTLGMSAASHSLFLYLCPLSSTLFFGPLQLINQLIRRSMIFRAVFKCTTNVHMLTPVTPVTLIMSCCTIQQLARTKRQKLCVFVPNKPCKLNDASR